ncbi:hypothetical protein CHS0354_012820 [Potamilus streckersoni]|uniref:VWFC domain-containing protein n=1 Tax=Potamilus streckersoni TaxID=2493646 RepID=A0AAE0SVY0_9BIVA|nr:hypothetical protein CHS0354_012820 [Potamilus streckersoni]
MSFHRAKNCLTLFIAVLPVFCRGHYPAWCLGADGKYYATGDLVPSTNPCEVECRCKGFDQVVCSITECAKPLCENPINIEGQCCPVCDGCTKDGVVYNTGDLVPSSNPCEVDCRCKGFDQVVCSITECAKPLCETPINIEGQCCPVCDGCNKDGVVYNTGDLVPSANPCEVDCRCKGFDQVVCSITECARLLCETPINIEGQCCPVCDGCTKDGVIYNTGDTVPSSNPCEVDCRCKGFDKVVCSIIECERPLCENPIIIEGQCCPVCDGCTKDGVVYNTGDWVPSRNPCEFDCRCQGFDQVLCGLIGCTKPQCKKPIHIEGQCCPVCDFCTKDGVVYNTGKLVNNDPCRLCTCQKSGQITCENIQCSKLTCLHQVVPKGECCPVCQCRHGNKYHLPGEIVKNVTCNPLICQSDGSIKAEPVKCEKLQCVNPIFPIGKCCPECKIGRTCERKKVIIKYGEDKLIGNEICRCGGDPWFPNAFCAVQNVSEKLLKNFGQYLDKYKP